MKHESDHVFGARSRAFDRRQFLQVAGGVAMSAAMAPLGLAALDDAKSQALARRQAIGGLIARFHQSLTEAQSRLICLGLDDPRRTQVANNWNVVDPETASIGKLFDAEQQSTLREILQGLLTEDGYQRLQRQMKDDSGGFENYTCAIFGGADQAGHELLMTGRHLTLRAGGDAKTPFGGPIFYGHAVEFNERPDHPGNVWWHQARLANQVFSSLDGKQRVKALLPGSPPDSPETGAFKGKDAAIPGLGGGDLSPDQKVLLRKTLGGLLSMFPQSDVDGVLASVDARGGVDALRISFYREEDLGEDGIWDRWRVEGPSFVWYFRGSPHVHVWVHVG